ncbi:50S ribosomal protein L11 [archaeon CG10_big_fil_rev_8_21_14_0_10_43_11]|nr:MAG: 50S ribosomal protein L11 [archaeon CG10_big_fil_rev_8_21_14_0_10_43_11]
MSEEIINLMVEGGAAKTGATLGMKLGPLGINLGKIAQDINDATSGFKGVEVPVTLTVDKKTKEYTIKVGTPPVPQLIKKRAKLEKGSATAGTAFVGDIPVTELIEIAKSKVSGTISKDAKAMLGQVVGTCVSIGVTIDGKNPLEVSKAVKAGAFDAQLA